MLRTNRAILFSLVFAIAPLRAEQFMIHAGRLIDVVNGEVMAKMSVTIDDHRIAATAPGCLDPTDIQTLVDLRDHTLLPGLMDMHTHLNTLISPTFLIEKFVMDSAAYAFRSAMYAEQRKSAPAESSGIT